MRIQANIGPRSHSLSGLNVFISYKSQDYSYASKIKKVLQDKGFDVTLFEPVNNLYRQDESEIRDRLRRSLLQADYMCLINSPETVSSQWVAYEFVQAALILGRVCLVDTIGSGPLTADRLLEAAQGFSKKKGLQVKHTSLSFKALGDQECEVIVKELLNSPDEQWFDGSTPIISGTIDLKRRSVLRKGARARVYTDWRFSDQIVEEIIPYINETEQAVPLEQKLMELLFGEGRLPVLDRYREGKVWILHAKYYLEEVGADVGVFVVVTRAFMRLETLDVVKGVFTDPRDGEIYKTLRIYGRTWLAENLRFASEGSWCYDDEPDNAKKYGRLYTWDGAISACPNGWHVASIREWLILASTFGGYRSNLDSSAESAANAEKSFEALIAGGDSGFDVELAGFRSYFKKFEYLDVDAYFWSGTELDTSSAHMLYFLGGAMETQHGSALKIAGHSVRCVLGESVDWRREP